MLPGGFFFKAVEFAGLVERLAAGVLKLAEGFLVFRRLHPLGAGDESDLLLGEVDTFLTPFRAAAIWVSSAASSFRSASFRVFVPLS